MIIKVIIMHDKPTIISIFMTIAILSMTRLMQEGGVSKTYLYVMSKAGGLTAETYFHDNQAFPVLVSMLIFVMINSSSEY